MIESVVKAAVELVSSVAGVFHIGNLAEKHIAQNSTVGESRIDKETRAWWDTILRSWYFVAFALLLLFGGLGTLIWKL